MTAVGGRNTESMLVGIAPSAPTPRAAQVSSGAPPWTPRTHEVAVAPASAPAGPTSAAQGRVRLRASADLVRSAPVPSDPPARPSSPLSPPCAGELWLAGSVVNDARPRLSLAMVRRAAGTAVVALGARVDDFTVLAIAPTHARLRASDGSECTLSEVPPGPTTAVIAPPPARLAPEVGDEPPPGKAMFMSGELARGVRVLGPNSYGVARALVLKALANPGGAAGGAWFRLSERDGQRIGMEVRAVREGTPLQAMGIRTGDVARSVNGVALDTPAGLIEALRAAREADSITISLVRDGQASDMRYTIE